MRETMKQPKKLTKKQKMCISAHYMNPKEWMLVEEIGSYLKVINKETGKTKFVDKHVTKK